MAISKKDILDAISEMSVMDIVSLVKDMEEKFGVSAAAAVQVAAAAPGTSAGAAAAEEKKAFNIALTAVGGNKVAVIKAVRELTGLGLIEAKKLVDGAPSTIKENVKKEEAEAAKKALEGAGATVELK